MDLETAIKLGQLGFVVAQAIVLLIIFLMKGTFATKKDSGAAHVRADAAHHRLDLLEQRVDQHPTHDDIRELREDLAKLGAQLGADMRENGVRIETAVLGVKRIEDYMIGAKK